MITPALPAQVTRTTDDKLFIEVGTKRLTDIFIVWITLPMPTYANTLSAIMQARRQTKYNSQLHEHHSDSIVNLHSTEYLRSYLCMTH